MKSYNIEIKKTLISLLTFRTILLKIPLLIFNTVINNDETHEMSQAQPPPTVNLNRRQSVAVTKRLQQRNSVIWNRKSFICEGYFASYHSIRSFFFNHLFFSCLFPLFISMDANEWNAFIFQKTFFIYSIYRFFRYLYIFLIFPALFFSFIVFIL